jgi:hypothetical protein
MMPTRVHASMKQFGQVVKEINKTLTQLIFFENIVNTTIVFMIFYFLFSIFDVPPFYSVAPALIYLGFYSYAGIKSKKHLIVEKRYEPLREKLRTAADNMDKENPIVEELEYEVTAEMKNIGRSLFINPRTISYKIFGVVLLSFLIIFATTMNLRVLEFAKRAPDIFDMSIKGVGDFTATELNTSDNIYGDEDVARLGDNELDIRIKPVDFSISVKEVGDIEHRDFETVFPQELAVKESAAFEENIPEEEQELVKNYFKKLAES